MRWDDIDKQSCSVARALSVVGERWTMLILRDAFLGTRRFEEFQRNMGITRHRLSERLRKLVENGVLVKVPYNDRPLRHEYRLSRKGLGLYPVLMSLAVWGDEWMDEGDGAPLDWMHQSCGHCMRAVLSCGECGEALKPNQVRAQLGPPLRAVAEGAGHQVDSPADIPALFKLSI